MSEKPLVTAVVTTYNRSVDIVNRALTSIVKQTYSNLEIILVNDSPENRELAGQLAQLCASYVRPVQYLAMPQNAGANPARNYGASRAKGQFIAFLDDDDEWFACKVEKQIQAFDHEKVGIVYCNTMIHSEKTHDVTMHYQKEMPEGNVFAQLFGSNIIGSTSFPMIRKKAFDEVGGFNEKMPALQDMELWLRIAQRYDAKYIAEPLGAYYFYAGERISSHPERRTNGYEQIYRQHEAYLEKNPKVLAAFDILGVTIYINARDFKTAWFHLSRAIKLAPGSIKRNGYTFIKFCIRIFIKANIV